MDVEGETRLLVDEFSTKEDSYPLVLNFQNGYVNDSINNTKCLLLENRENQCKTVAMEVEDQIYTGDEQLGGLGVSFLMARNRKTGKVRLIEVGNVSMKPLINAEKENVPEVLDKTTDLELNRKFGSKKAKKLIEQKEKLKVTKETVAKQMENVVTNTSIDQIDLQEYAGVDSIEFYVPKMNKNAERLNQIYPLENIMSDEMYDKIYAEVEDKEIDYDLSESMLSLYKSRTLTPRETVLALYYSGIIKVYQEKAKVLGTLGYSFSELSPSLHTQLLNAFTQKIGKRVLRPAAYRDRALAHALVIGMLLNNYVINLDNFAAEFKISAASAVTKSSVTGATLKKEKGVRLLQLKLPLNFRQPFRRRSK